MHADDVRAGIARVARHAGALLVPPSCVGCRSGLAAADALALCPECLRALRWIGPDGCRRCGLPAHGGRPCPARDAPWSTAWAPVAYAGPAAALVRALKFRGALPLLDLMAAQMATNLPAWSRPTPGGTGTAAGAWAARSAAAPDATGAYAARSAAAPDVTGAWAARSAAAPDVTGACAAPLPAAVVVPVPAVAARRRRRGFDAADGLAVRVAERLGLPVARPLRRAGHARQLGSGRAQRRAAAGLDVSIVTAVTLSTDTVLLVDDVHTTGATLRASAAILRSAGVRRVHAVTYARTL